MHTGVLGIKKMSYGYDLENIISECTFPKSNIGNVSDKNPYNWINALFIQIAVMKYWDP